MTEAEWMACADSLAMQTYLRHRPSQRKLRLLSCCYWRSNEPFMSVRGADELAAAVEEWSDGVTQGGLVEARLDNLDLPQEHSRSRPAMRLGFCSEDAFVAVTYTTAWATGEEPDEEQKCCDQIRCIFGNPFRTVSND